MQHNQKGVEGMSNKIIKSVSLNITVAEDQLILKHIKRRNFSGYVKKLILADIEQRKGVKPQNEAVEAVKKDMKTDIKIGDGVNLKIKE